MNSDFIKSVQVPRVFISNKGVPWALILGIAVCKKAVYLLQDCPKSFSLWIDTYGLN